MKYSFINFLFAWLIPYRFERRKFREIFKRLDSRILNKKIQKRYKKISSNLKNKTKIKVLFLVNEISKWKSQSLYDEMAKNSRFEPVIALTISDIQVKLPDEEKEKIITDNYNYFKSKGMNVVYAYDTALKTLNPDIVFYQQPYSMPRNQDIPEVSKYALTCYIPYYLPDYQNFDLDCEHNFHHNLFRFYVLNEELASTYKSHLQAKEIFNGNIKPAGHTVLDTYKNFRNNENKDYVIYAPHWSITHKNNDNNINISTFMETGAIMLEYAQNHPEINWVFKPHPTLKTALKRIGEWSNEQIENYYKAWENIAYCSYDADYPKIFFASKAMITDCGSFLLEYFLTGRPLVHLVSNTCSNKPYNFLNKIFNSFYHVYDKEDLTRILDDLIIQNNDYKKEQRLRILQKTNLLDNNAAENIIKDLSEVIL